MVNSKIYVGQVIHGRRVPVKHDFQYPLYLYAFDLDELEKLNKKYFWFGYNCIRPIAIHDKDYLAEVETTSSYLSLKAKLKALLVKHQCHVEIEKVILLTAARYLNYVFNPVSFFYCYDKSGEISVIVTEINNTFDERHIYIIEAKELTAVKENGELQQRNAKQDKAFHVSPFNDMAGEYDFYFTDIEKTLDIRINIVREGNTVFVSRLFGAARSFSSMQMMLTLIKYPLTASLSMPRILWQAAKLHYLKKLPVYKKPHPNSELTIKVAAPSYFENCAQKPIFNFLSKLKRGTLKLTLPDGSIQHFEGKEEKIAGQSTNAQIQLKNYGFFWKVMTRGAVGLGESYCDGDWDSDNVTAVLALLIENRDVLDEKQLGLAQLARGLNRIRHLLRRNTITGSRRNIEEHYDLSNEFYQQILDPSLSYSCALFQSKDENLESAQHNKIKSLLDKLELDEKSRVLEIGSGWGSLACQAAQSHGCKVTSITLSKEQLQLAQKRSEDQGLQDKVEFKMCDYRDVKGSYDRIVSVEMLEAVGDEYLGRFFETCDRVLAPDGIVVLQVITMPEQRYQRYRKGCDWIQKYIFPGACVPSFQAISNAIAKHSSFLVEKVENIGPHYAPTLASWRHQLYKHKEKLEKLGYDEYFQRTWEYYFSYCEAAFSTRTLNVLQLVLTRPNNHFLRERDRK